MIAVAGSEQQQQPVCSTVAVVAGQWRATLASGGQAAGVAFQETVHRFACPSVFVAALPACLSMCVWAPQQTAPTRRLHTVSWVHLTAAWAVWAVWVVQGASSSSSSSRGTCLVCCGVLWCLAWPRALGLCCCCQEALLYVQAAWLVAAAVLGCVRSLELRSMWPVSRDVTHEQV